MVDMKLGNGKMGVEKLDRVCPRQQMLSEELGSWCFRVMLSEDLESQCCKVMLSEKLGTCCCRVICSRGWGSAKAQSRKSVSVSSTQALVHTVFPMLSAYPDCLTHSLLLFPNQAYFKIRCFRESFFHDIVWLTKKFKINYA